MPLNCWWSAMQKTSKTFTCLLGSAVASSSSSSSPSSFCHFSLRFLSRSPCGPSLFSSRPPRSRSRVSVVTVAHATSTPKHITFQRCLRRIKVVQHFPGTTQDARLHVFAFIMNCLLSSPSLLFCSRFRNDVVVLVSAT